MLNVITFVSYLWKRLEASELPVVVVMNVWLKNLNYQKAGLHYYICKSLLECTLELILSFVLKEWDCFVPYCALR